MVAHAQTVRPPRGNMDAGTIKAVLGPTNTGKTHLAIERLCAHSSGAIGFPLRLLAREVYDRVCAIKGPGSVALITGEERIEPANARWLLCTVEAFPREADLAFVAIDEAQLGADPERGHVFTDRLLRARGREETMLLGSATLAPMVRALVPEAEIVSRPRFSTLSHAGARKLSRLPPRSAIVAFSAEQVYAVAEMLRRFRGGAAVVMGALSPQTRNAQVAMFQSGEVDYIVATDAIGMGLNLDVTHVAFAGLSKFDGHRQRRLTVSEMAQIAGRAGRHQRDGSFGTLSGAGGRDAAFTDEEVYAIEEHRFPPLTQLYWRNPTPRFSDVGTLIADLAQPPDHPALRAAPEAIDVAVLKLLAGDPEIVGAAKGTTQVRRLWEVCSLPDFRQLGADQHARFVARLWQDLGREGGFLGSDFVAQRIAELDNPGGDIDALGARIAAIRSWAYIAQRPDWVLAKEEMASRARAVESRLSDALHARLTERFVNRRTSVLMRKLGPDSALLPVRLDADGAVLVDDEPIGHLDGFHFRVDAEARMADRKLLLAAGERHLPRLLAQRAETLLAELGEGAAVALDRAGATVTWHGWPIARLTRGRAVLHPRLALDRSLETLPPPMRQRIEAALAEWLDRTLTAAIGPLRAIEAASTDSTIGPAMRALLAALVDAGGAMARGPAIAAAIGPEQRQLLRRLGIRTGTFDIWQSAMLKPEPMRLAAALIRLAGRPAIAVAEAMHAALLLPPGPIPAGYRRLGRQLVRVDMAEKLLRAAHDARGPQRRFQLGPDLALSMGLTTASYAALLRLAGFRPIPPRVLDPAAFGPPAPVLWDWRPPRPIAPLATPARAAPVDPANPFAILAGRIA